MSAHVVDRQALIMSSDRSPSDVLLRRTSALLNHLKGRIPQSKWDAHGRGLRQLYREAENVRGALSKSRASAGTRSSADRELFMKTAALHRRIAFDNPLLDFDDILFCAYGMSRSHHMCDQYFACKANTGGGLFILKDAFSENARAENVLEGVTVAQGADYEGRSLEGGAFLSPELTYDGTTIYFAWSEASGDDCWSVQSTYHLFKCGIDGSNLTQLTSGEWNEFDPCELPSGRIVFISERRGGHGRCHGRPVPTYTLHSMKPDGSDIIRISYHETNEWHPSVDNNGMIVYTRWDYVDRDSDIAHHLWLCYPDGRDPRAPHGNYPHPWTTQKDVPASVYEPPDWKSIYYADGLEGKHPVYGEKIGETYYPKDGRWLRPWMEMNIRGIPGSQKYVATAAPHHGQAFGSLILIDVNREDDGMMSQVERLTPDALFPESETGIGAWDLNETGYQYGTPWPLSEDLYLCNYWDGIYLLDRFGGKQLLYKNEQFRPIDPIPLRPRPTPHDLGVKTWQGERRSLEHPPATIKVSNIYDTYPLPWPDGVVEEKKIKWLRIVQLFPKTTHDKNKPKIGFAMQGIARMSLGIVPVEEDGSVYCKAPVGKSIYFQALDANKMAIHSMRSVTYVHPGEKLVCYGCHEKSFHGWYAPPSLPKTPIAFQRQPSELEPEFPGHHTDPTKGAIPFNFHLLVKPIFENKCSPCHAQNGKNTDFSYGWTLMNRAFFFHAGFNGAIRYDEHGGSRTVPGYYGAMHSTIGKNYLKSHTDKLSDEEWTRVFMWLDLNSNELGVYKDTSQQRSGQVAWPELDVDPDDPIGTEEGAVTVSSSRSAPREIDIVPAGRSLRIAGSGGEEVEVTVHDLAGRLVTARSITGGGSGDRAIAMHDLPRGTFVVRVQSTNRSRKASVRFVTLPVSVR